MSDEMVTRVGYDPLVRVLDRLDKMLTAAGSPPETPHEEAVGALIAERDRLREALRDALVLLENGDFANGVTHFGLDEGAMAAGHMIERLRQALGEGEP